MINTFRGVVGVVVGMMAVGGAAVAQTTAPSGPVVFRNETKSALTLTNFRYTDESGKVREVDGQFDVPAKFDGFLTVEKKKIRARKFEYDLVTADGTSEGWSCVAKAVDGDGNFVSVFTPKNLAEHKKTLGVTDKEAADQPLTEERQKQIAAGVVKALLALVPHEATKQEPETLGDVFAIELARGLRDELLKSAINDLFPDMGTDASDVAGELAGKALDGRLTGKKLTAAQAQKQVADDIRDRCPKFDSADELAAFLVGLQAGAREKK